MIECNTCDFRYLTKAAIIRDMMNMSNKQSSENPAPSVQWGLAGLCLSMLMPSLDTSIANAGLPVLLQAFDASFQYVQWIILAYLLAITALIVSVGRLGDMVGRRRLLLVGLVVFNAASLLCGIAPTLWFLIAARALQGLGAAVMMSLTIAFVSETVPKERVGSAMGLLGTMSAIGTTLGPSVGGALTGAFGWRTIFLVNLPLGIVNFILAYRHLPEDGRDALAGRRAVFDKTGTAVLAITLTAYSLAMTLGGFGPLNLALLLIAASGVLVFLLVERKAASPLISLPMLRNRVLGGSLATSALVTTVMMATMIVGPFYLSHAIGLGPGLVGFVLSIGPLAAALGGLPAGRLVDRFGARGVMLSGLSGLVIACSVLSVTPLSFGVIGYILPVVLATTSYAMFQAANNTRIMTGIAPDQRGVVSGMLSLSRNLGLITGASMMGAVFALGSGASDLVNTGAEALTAGMHVTFAVAAVLIAAAIAIAIGSLAGSSSPIEQTA